ncbi:serine/threonine-protein kinase [Rhodococcus opacus]|uniref:non-specific serine/threonine protein kinase n=1 Tax=Rhodococcus opacus TaxID=37919 RepID=A0A1B1K5K8_RHOOP|nr:serine/threonine-protein kinase [Rhodococcus opacus]ANS27907.1 serine/threonine-protein kinase [Rhodococcus opacus]
MPGSVVLAGRYELREVLGRGGMADVYDGWDQRLARAVAVKVLRPEMASEPQTRRRFESEARLAATLNHPNVVAVHDSGDDHGAPYIVMERLPGRTLLDDLLAGPLPAPRARTILTQTLDALGAAHAAGILHRDIKPGNILFDADGTVKVTDFGIAKRADTDHTTAGEVLGTVAYLSPDRITGKPASVTDDLYAVGVVGYEALAGHRPYTGDTILSLAHAIVHGHHEPLTAGRPDLDPTLIAVIERALSRDPQQRFATAAQMRNALANPRWMPPPPTRVVTSIPAAAVPLGPPAQPRRSPGAGVIISAVAAVLVTIALLALAVASQDERGTIGSTSVPPPTAPIPSSYLAPAPAPPATMISSEPIAPAPEIVAPDDTAPGAGVDTGGGNGNQGGGNQGNGQGGPGNGGNGNGGNGGGGRGNGGGN